MSKMTDASPTHSQRTRMCGAPGDLLAFASASEEKQIAQRL